MYPTELSSAFLQAENFFKHAFLIVVTSSRDDLALHFNALVSVTRSAAACQQSHAADRSGLFFCC